jgi:prophage regulatory protein
MYKVIRQRETIQLTGLSRTTIWRLERAGLFPQRRRIGRQAVGWLASDIDEWLATRPRGPQPARQDAT